MTHVDLHPEDLFDGLRAGVLPRDARARLLSHCARCEPCQFELRLIEGQHFVMDETAHAAQLADAALRQLSWPPPAPVARVRGARRVTQQLAAAAALLVLGFGFGALAMFSSLPRALDALFGREPRTPTLEHVETGEPGGAAARSAPEVPREPKQGGEPALAADSSKPQPTAATPPSDMTRSDGFAPGVRPAPQRVRHGHTDAARSRRKRATMPLTAAGLSTRPFSEADAEAALSLATQARSTGYEGEAVERYRLVIERFPSTRAAGAAQVALGRLLYKELAQPSEALPLFDAYLARPGAHELAEEALYHRGMCLIALRRVSEASASLRQLLERFPGSMYAAQARAKLSRLRE